MENKKIALVTGASSGLGRDMSKILASRGYNIIAVARNVELLSSLKKEIEDTNSDLFVDIQITDLSNKEEVIELYNRVKKIYGNIDILINNAGFGKCGYFLDIKLEDEVSMIETNITALHILTKLFLHDMNKRNYGYIMNVASIAGFMPGPLMATYYSTKSYVVRLSESIAYELKKHNSKVKISCLCPGPVNTNFFKVADVSFSLKGADSYSVSNYAIKKMFKNKLMIYPQLRIKAAIFFSRFVSNRFIASICYKLQRKKIYK